MNKKLSPGVLALVGLGIFIVGLFIDNGSYATGTAQGLLVVVALVFWIIAIFQKIASRS
ncbi:MAG TPA: hypothetical protein VMQ44_02345 [Candidatus Saccharimonadales bacterium]|nr:hypothetical protein [Candidatus Saccharimonadales bacterium]